MNGCILLRYNPNEEEEEIISKLILFLENKTLQELTGKFITISTDKIRIAIL